MLTYSKIVIFLFLFNSISPLLFILKPGQERCLIDEFLEQNYFIVKHKIFTENKQDIKKFLPQIHFHVKEVETNRIIFNSYIYDVKDKISQKVIKTGLYKVCLSMNKNVPRDLMKLTIFVNLKITSDNMEKNDFTNAIKSEDINKMQRLADSIIRLINQATEIQKGQLNAENEKSLETLSNAQMYKYLNFGQIVISVVIGLIQFNNFRKFLKSKNIV